jgi:hypothetical protein
MRYCSTSSSQDWQCRDERMGECVSLSLVCAFLCARGVDVQKGGEKSRCKLAGPAGAGAKPGKEKLVLGLEGQVAEA